MCAGVCLRAAKWTWGALKNYFSCKKERVSKNVARYVWCATQGRCYYCKAHLGDVENRLGRWEVDHLVPQYAGGSFHIQNLVAACRMCNRSKGKHRVQKWAAKQGIRLRCTFVYTQTEKLLHKRKAVIVPQYMCILPAVNNQGALPRCVAHL